eukprot:1312477-Amphidinium_carterae.1
MTDLEIEEQWKIESEIPYFKDLVVDAVYPGDEETFLNLKGAHDAFLDDQKYIHREVEGVLPPDGEYFRCAITKMRLGRFRRKKAHKRELSIAIGRDKDLKMVGTVSWVDPAKFGKPQGRADLRDVQFDQISEGMVSFLRKSYLEEHIGKLLMRFSKREYIVDFEEFEKQGEFLAMYARLHSKVLTSD